MSMMVNPYRFGGGGGGGPPPAARYWRVAILETVSFDQGVAAVSAAKIEMRSIPGGADIATGGTPNASSGNPTSAFDASPSTFWLTANSGYGTHWISYDFGSDVSIVEIAYSKRPDAFGVNEAPTFGEVQRSSDNLNWTTDWVFFTTPDWGTGAETRVFTKIASPTFSYVNYFATGSDQTYVVPPGVTVLHVGLVGAGGGGGSFSPGETSGAGGYTYVTIPVTPGDVLTIQVGVGGQRASPGGSGNGGVGGWPDGGGGSRGDGPGGGGGGSTRVWLNGVLIAVAGGGGADAGFSGNGGAGGGSSGQSASILSGGTGGSQVAGGFDGNNSLSVPKRGVQITSIVPARTGGWGGSTGDTTTTTTDDGGGGGGGFWGGGGGGGDAEAGGGGSGYIAPGYTGATFAGNFRYPPDLVRQKSFYANLYGKGAPSGPNRTDGRNGLVVFATSVADLS